MRFLPFCRRKLPSLGVAFGLLGLGLARAQSSPPAPPPAPPGIRADAAISLQRPVPLTAEEMRKNANRIVSRIDIAAANVRKMLEQSRSQGSEGTKVYCLSQALTELDTVLRLAKGRRATLEAQATLKRDDLVTHEYTILLVHRKNAEDASSAANLCVGSDAGFIGDTKTTVSVDPRIPDGEGTTGELPPYPIPPPLFVPPPICASCALLGCCFLSG